MNKLIRVLTVVPTLIDAGEAIAKLIRKRRARKAAEKLREAGELAREIQAKVDAEKKRRGQR